MRDTGEAELSRQQRAQQDVDGTDCQTEEHAAVQGQGSRHYGAAERAEAAQKRQSLRGTFVR